MGSVKWERTGAGRYRAGRWMILRHQHGYCLFHYRRLLAPCHPYPTIEEAQTAAHARGRRTAVRCAGTSEGTRPSASASSAAGLPLARASARRTSWRRATECGHQDRDPSAAGSAANSGITDGRAGARPRAVAAKRRSRSSRQRLGEEPRAGDEDRDRRDLLGRLCPAVCSPSGRCRRCAATYAMVARDACLLGHVHGDRSCMRQRWRRKPGRQRRWRQASRRVRDCLPGRWDTLRRAGRGALRRRLRCLDRVPDGSLRALRHRELGVDRS